VASRPTVDFMTVATYETLATDVLVLGAGGAGLRGAIAAAETGAKVLIVCKSLLGKAHTVMAEGGVAAAMHNVAYQDTWEVHFADTMKGGKLLNDWRTAELHARESPERVLELERWGAVFDRTWQGRIPPRRRLADPVSLRRAAPRHRRGRQDVPRHLELVGEHRRRNRARVRGGRPAARHGDGAVPPHGHGVAGGRARHPGHRRSAGRGR